MEVGQSPCNAHAGQLTIREIRGMVVFCSLAVEHLEIAVASAFPQPKSAYRWEVLARIWQTCDNA
jgi:hypothetical protein